MKWIVSRRSPLSWLLFRCTSCLCKWNIGCQFQSFPPTDTSHSLPPFPSPDLSTQSLPERITMSDIKKLQNLYRDHCEVCASVVKMLVPTLKGWGWTWTRKLKGQIKGGIWPFWPFNWRHRRSSNVETPKFQTEQMRLLQLKLGQYNINKVTSHKSSQKQSDPGVFCGKYTFIQVGASSSADVRAGLEQNKLINEVSSIKKKRDSCLSKLLVQKRVDSLLQSTGATA